MSRLAIASMGLAALLGLLALAALAEGRVHDSPEAVEPLQPGDRVPPLPVRTVEGRSLDLSERVRDGGALLVFYRGGW